MYLDKALAIVIIIFAIIGAFIVSVILLYIFFAILDLTYHERHKTNKNKCPDKIEGEE